MATKSFSTFLDEVADDATEGANAYAGRSLGDRCGWVFGGYAMPLLDPLENHARETAQDGSCAPIETWTPYLDHHVFTTSTSTVYVRDAERWRIFIQHPVLAQDVGTVDTIQSVFPSGHPALGDARYPFEDQDVIPGVTPTPWTDSDRFLREYIVFVDSPDGGRTFPVYAPKMHTRRFDQTQEGGSGGCLEDPAWNVDGVDIFTEGRTAANPDKAADWFEAGWTPTIVPCLSSSDRAGPDGVH